MPLPILQKAYRRLAGDRGFTEILVGSAFAMGSRIGTALLTLASSMLIARLYGAEAMGTLALITSLLSIATVFTVLGTNTAILRLIPEHLLRFSATSAYYAYRKTEGLVVVASILVGLLIWFFSGRIATEIFGKPALTGLIAVSAGALAFKSLMFLNTHAVRGLKLIRTYSFLLLLPQLLFLAFLGGWQAWNRGGAIPVYAQLAAWSLTGLVGSAIMHGSFRRRIQPGDRVEPTTARSILGLSLPMMLSASMYIVIGQTGVVVLGMHWPESVVGYYAVAVKLALLASFILVAINTIAAPTFAHLFHANEIPEMIRVAKKSARLIFWLTMPVFVALVVGGRWILSLFKPEFAVAYPALLVLVVGQFVNSISGSTEQLLNMTGGQKILRNIMVAAALGNVALNVLLTPRWGIMGAALAAAACTIGWNLAALAFIRRRFGAFVGYVPLLALRFRGNHGERARDSRQEPQIPQ